MFELFVFAVAAVAIMAGAFGVVLARNPVHSALMLVLTLFGVAVVFVAKEAHFLAAVQVIVYAGAIVVLILFVLMLLGVDRAEDLRVDPIGGQRPAAVAVGVAGLGIVLALAVVGAEITGQRSASGSLQGDDPNVVLLGRTVFTEYVFAFEVTSVLLVIAIVAAVVLAKRPPQGIPLDEDEEDAAAERVERMLDRHDPEAR